MGSVTSRAEAAPLPEEARRRLSECRTRIFADGPRLTEIDRLLEQPFIRGFTTNPTLLRNAGVEDYAAFGRQLLERVRDLPVSFEVVADELTEMERQAHTIAGWARNVYVKIPASTTDGRSSRELVRRLSGSGVKVNVTAVLALEQVEEMADALDGGAAAFVSVFAGRVADTGRDPMPLMAQAVEVLRERPNVELMWASPRELLNVFQADAVGCHVITLTSDLLAKLELIGKDLRDYSTETAAMLHGDARRAGYEL
jgi:transaldolase